MGLSVEVIDRAAEPVARVLIIDDEPAISTALAKKLRLEGYECLTAGSAEEGLGRVPEFAPHVIVCDVRMPGMSGLQLLREVKQQEPGVKVILITAYAEVELVIEALRGRADDYLLKPFSLKELASSVARTLEIGQESPSGAADGAGSR